MELERERLENETLSSFDELIFGWQCWFRGSKKAVDLVVAVQRSPRHAS